MSIRQISKLIPLAAILISLLFWSMFVTAATTPRTKTPQDTLKILTQQSQIVIEGRLLKANPSYYDQDPLFGNLEKIIVTDYRVMASRVLKGNLNVDEVLVRIPGGCIEADDLCFKTDLMPTLKSDENIILFLNPTADKKWTIWDFADGKQTIKESICLPLNLSFQETVGIIEEAQ